MKISKSTIKSAAKLALRGIKKPITRWQEQKRRQALKMQFDPKIQAFLDSKQAGNLMCESHIGGGG